MLIFLKKRKVENCDFLKEDSDFMSIRTKILKFTSILEMSHPKSITNRVFSRFIKTYFSKYISHKFYLENADTNRFWKRKKNCFVLSFDCDTKKDYESMPKLLKVLQKYDIRASFAIIGKWIELKPDIHKQMINEGHELLNHSYLHPQSKLFYPEKRFNEISFEERKYQIEKAHEVFLSVLNYKPVGFRTPHFGNSHTEDIYRILKNLGYKYSTSTIAIRTPKFGLPFITKEGVVEFPLSMHLENPYRIYDPYLTFNSPFGNLSLENQKKYFGSLQQAFELTMKAHSFMNVFFDPADINRLEYFEYFLKYLSENSDNTSITTYSEIVDYYNE